MATRSMLAALLLLTARPALADPGMWMPQQIPMLAEELRDLGLQMDPEAFADLTGFPMGAIVSLGGCSGTFVSPEGLILTNHHCVDGSLQYNSTPDRDLLRDGFLARTQEDEVPARPDARVYVTTDIQDVTARIAGDLPPGISDAERARTIDARRKELLAECEEAGDVRCWVRSFFGGETYLKLTATILRDVRLVYAPTRGIGNFGGEVDNWSWPRHTGDFAYYRVYVAPDGSPAEYSPDNVPYRPEHHLKVSTRDLDPEDLVLLAGYPGRTRRLVTAEEARDAQRVTMPEAVRLRTELGSILRAHGEGHREVAIRNAARLRGLDNYKKKETGVLAAFERDGLLAQKLEAERELEEFYGSDPEKASEYRAIREEFSGVLAQERATRDRDRVFAWMATASPLLSQARMLVRMAEERAKPDAERESGYQERDWENRRNSIRRVQRQIEPGTDRAGLRWILAEALALPDDQRIAAIDDALGADPNDAELESFLDGLYAGTTLTDEETRLAMFTESTEELRSRRDPFLDLAFALRPLGREIEEADDTARGARQRLRPQLIAAMRAMRDGRLAPDANGTLRITFGAVRGYEARDAVTYHPHTTVRGILEKDTGERPFDSPPRLLELARAESFGPYGDPDLGSLPVAFVATVNVTNGSSGSSALNAWGEIIGLAFDMNWEGIGADWVVNEDVVRTIIVDSRYMLWVMDAVDGAHRLLEEMDLPVHFRTGSTATGRAP